MKLRVAASALAAVLASGALTGCESITTVTRSSSCDMHATRENGPKRAISHSQINDLDNPQRLIEIFNKTAQESGIPVEVLQAIAYVETRWHSSIPNEERAHGEDDVHMRVYGVMGLKNDSFFGESLLDAAALIKKEPKEVTQNPELNIQAAAAYLKSLQENPDASSSDPADWYESIRKYSGLSNQADAEDYLMQVHRVLKKGVHSEGIKILPFKNLKDPKRLSLKIDSLPFREYLETSDKEMASPKPPVAWDPSPNFTSRGLLTPRYIVIHVTEGNFSGAVSWLKNPKAKVSSHYVIRSSDGFIKQLVKDTDRAWHARCWNQAAIGIEHEGFIGKPSQYFTDDLYNSSSELVRYLTEKYSIPRSRVRILGHDAGDGDLLSDTDLGDCNDHGDPGRGWDWMKYFTLINGTSFEPLPGPGFDPTPLPSVGSPNNGC